MALERSDIYKLLFDSVVEGMVITDAAGTIVLTNPRLPEIFGYQREELLGMPIEILIPSVSRSRHQELRERYAEQPEKRTMGIGRDLKGLRKDGSLFPLEVSLNHMMLENERFFLGLVTDISARKQIENQIQELNRELENRVNQRTAALQESQELYVLIARSFPKGSINVLDETLTCVFAEGKDLVNSGLDPNTLVGTKYVHRYSTDQHVNLSEKLNMVFGGVSENLIIADHDRFYNINAVPLTNKAGKISRILIVERDITEEKRYEREMAKALERERELNELKSRFLAIASHEFRTPLSTIMSSASLAARYDSADQLEKRHKHLDRIRSSVYHLTNILNDFLSLSKLEEGLVFMQLEKIEVREFFTSFQSEMQEIAREGQSINLKLAVHKPFVCVDPNLLKNVCLNLVSNAIKYSPEGGSIDLEVKENESKGLIISVTDHGIGIPEEEQKNLFERFFRAKNAANIQGTGLGLNIIERFIDIMNGSITFKSTEGKGTTFEIELPLNNCDEENTTD